MANAFFGLIISLLWFFLYFAYSIKIAVMKFTLMRFPLGKKPRYCEYLARSCQHSDFCFSSPNGTILLNKYSEKFKIWVEAKSESLLVTTKLYRQFLKKGSDEIIYWLCLILGFIMYVKKTKRIVILYSNQKFSTKPLKFFWHHKTQKERESIVSIYHLIRPPLSNLS